MVAIKAHMGCVLRSAVEWALRDTFSNHQELNMLNRANGLCLPAAGLAADPDSIWGAGMPSLRRGDTFGKCPRF